MSTADRSTDTDAQSMRVQVPAGERADLSLLHNEDEGTVTLASAPPGELTVSPTEWLTVDEDALVDAREYR
jgi:hypothetical protein